MRETQRTTNFLLAICCTIAKSSGPFNRLARQDLKKKSLTLRRELNPSLIVSRMSWHTIKEMKNTKLFTTKSGTRGLYWGSLHAIVYSCHCAIAQLSFPFNTSVRLRIWASRRAGTVCTSLPLFLFFFFFFFYFIFSSLKTQKSRDRGPRWSGTEPTTAMNRAGRTSATKWEASGTVVRVSWRHRASSLFCHSTASASREKGARMPRRGTRMPRRGPLLSAMPFFFFLSKCHRRRSANSPRW